MARPGFQPVQAVLEPLALLASAETAPETISRVERIPPDRADVFEISAGDRCLGRRADLESEGSAGVGLDLVTAR